MRPRLHATKLITAEQWQARTWAAIQHVPRCDYRSTEAKIGHRRYMSRWFEEWARQYRPGTHHSSVAYGLTWQWVHVGHAHLDL